MIGVTDLIETFVLTMYFVHALNNNILALCSSAIDMMMTSLDIDLWILRRIQYLLILCRVYIFGVHCLCMALPPLIIGAIY